MSEDNNEALTDRIVYLENCLRKILDVDLRKTESVSIDSKRKSLIALAGLGLPITSEWPYMRTLHERDMQEPNREKNSHGTPDTPEGYSVIGVDPGQGSSEEIAFYESNPGGHG